MKPVRTPEANVTLTLPGGTQDNDLPACRAMLYNQDLGETEKDAVLGFVTVWQPDEHEARQLEAGACIELTVWGKGHPPVAVSVTKAIVPERELIDRGHVDRALGYLYGVLQDTLRDSVHGDENGCANGLPAPADLATMWADAVEQTRMNPETRNAIDGAFDDARDLGIIPPHDTPPDHPF
jgi:hypothetical protein